MTPTELKRKQAAETVAWAHEALALPYEDIGAAVDADERTVRRWEGRTTAPQARHRERLESLQELKHLLGVVFPEKRNADEWLHASLPAFRGRSPLAMIRRGKIDDVVAVLATIESGAYL